MNIAMNAFTIHGLKKDKPPHYYKVYGEVCGISVEAVTVHTIPELSKRLGVPRDKLKRMVVR